MTNNAPKMYGKAPVDLGKIDISPTEMLFWLYCPIKLPGSLDLSIPPNLKQFWNVIEACWHDCDYETWFNRYVYITAKTLWVTHENPGQRRGWHCDGFMTDDINYIWSDANPTLFAVTDQPIAFTQDHKTALEEMEFVGEQTPSTSYGLKHLLRLDQTVLHRVGDFPKAGMRSFVKISVSEHPYNLVGNSINHELAPDWNYQTRAAERNPEVAKLNDHV